MSSTALIPKPTIAVQIQTLMDEHQMDELKNFISRRSCLNKCNLFLIYLFSLVRVLRIQGLCPQTPAKGCCPWTPLLGALPPLDPAFRSILKKLG